MFRILPKPTFEEFISTFTPFLNVSELEEEIRIRVQSIASDLLDFQPSDNPSENLKRFLKKDKNFIGVILAMANLSQEKFLRIISAKRFSEGDLGAEWNIDTVYRKICSDDNFAEIIAQMFIEGREHELLSEIIPNFYLDQLALPSAWDAIIRDQQVIGNVVRKKLTGEYTNMKGDHVENQIKRMISLNAEEYGFTFAQGQVQAMGIGKEVDIAIPSLDDPCILIMVSYMETTSSGQTARANEQSEIYQRILAHNIRYNTTKKFINFIDGAGWLARRSDLIKLYNGCDYCLNLNTMEQLKLIIFKYLPTRFFSIMQPPRIED